MTQNIFDYGYSFQIKLISSLLEDRNFLQQTYDIIDPSLFQHDGIKVCIETILQYYRKYNKTPTPDALKVNFQDIENELLKVSVVDVIKDVYHSINSEDLDFVKDQSLSFFKNQSLKKAINDSIDLLRIGDYEGIRRRVEEALQAGMERNVGLEYFDNIEDRYAEEARTTIPTPWFPINELMDGGLSFGELGVVMAPPGIGKSWALVSIAAHAVKMGKKVIYYTIELNQNYVGMRFDSLYSGISSKDLKYHLDDVKERLKDVMGMDGNLIIKYYPDKTASINTLKAHTERCMMLGFEPDLIIVDYADNLIDADRRNNDLRLQLSNIYRDLRGMGGIYGVPIWTATQANRSSSNDEIIQADAVAESFNKIMISDFIVSLSRKIEDKTIGTARFHVIKNRFGKDGVTLPAKVNFDIGVFEVFNANSKIGQDVQTEMNNKDKIIKDLLRSKLEKLDSKK